MVRCCRLQKRPWRASARAVPVSICVLIRPGRLPAARIILAGTHFHIRGVVFVAADVSGVPAHRIRYAVAQPARVNRAQLLCVSLCRQSNFLKRPRLRLLECRADLRAVVLEFYFQAASPLIAAASILPCCAFRLFAWDWLLGLKLHQILRRAFFIFRVVGILPLLKGFIGDVIRTKHTCFPTKKHRVPTMQRI